MNDSSNRNSGDHVAAITAAKTLRRRSQLIAQRVCAKLWINHEDATLVAVLGAVEARTHGEAVATWISKRIAPSLALDDTELTDQMVTRLSALLHAKLPPWQCGV